MAAAATGASVVTPGGGEQDDCIEHNVGSATEPRERPVTISSNPV